jgi:tetratricopeptide (TPR) repeat protein
MEGDTEQELPDDIHVQVTQLSEQGNVYLNAGIADKAITVWKEALHLLPTPQRQWEAATWLHASLGNAFRSTGDFENALSHFQSAASSADGQTNPFVLISLGATFYDLGRIEEATDPLLRTFMLEGRDIFEEFGGPYFDHLLRRKLVG